MYGSYSTSSGQRHCVPGGGLAGRGLAGVLLGTEGNTDLRPSHPTVLSEGKSIDGQHVNECLWHSIHVLCQCQ